MNASFEVIRKTFDEVTPEEVADWQGLIATYPEHQRAFLSPCFFAAAQRSFGTVVVIFLKQRASVLGVLGLMCRRSFDGLFGVYEPVGGVMTDYFGLTAVPGLKISVTDVLSRARIGCVVFSHLDETQSAHGLSGANPRIGLRTRLHGSGGDYWESLRGIDKKLVNDTERRERKLQTEHGEIFFEFQSTKPDFDLAELIQMKKAQYARTGKFGAPLFDEANVKLLRDLLHSKDPQCHATLSVLRVNGRLVAAHFGLRCMETLHFWFPVYEPAFSSYSPGRILYRHVMEAASSCGITLLDRGEGDTKAKRDFANDEHLFYMGVWYTGFRGLIGRLALATSWRVQAWRGISWQKKDVG